MPRACTRPASLVFAIVLAINPSAGLGAPDDDPDSLEPGVLARFVADAAPGVEALRSVPVLSWDWSGGSPDLRLPADGFRLAAEGSLLVQSTGTYRFYVRAGGVAGVLKVGDRVVCEGTGQDWAGTPVDLRVGFVPVRLEARAVPGSGRRLSVDWQGPTFARETLPARLLYHERAETPTPDRFEQGRRLADRLGCGNCHDRGLSSHRALGPPLPDAVSGADPRWLFAWLKDPTSARPRTRMPAFGRGLDDAGAADLLAYLARLGEKDRRVTAEVRMAMNVASPEKGRLLFRSLGCLACHARGEKPSKGRPAAPDLDGVGRTRRPEALAAYLERPKGGKLASRHRPDLRLSADESAHLAAYLTEDAEPVLPVDPPAAGDPKRGEALAARLRCVACHALPKVAAAATVPFPREPRADSGCLATEAPSGRSDVPRYALDADERAALRAFVAGLSSHVSPPAFETRAHDSVSRLNCLGCHARDGRGGTDLSGRLAPLLSQDTALGGLKGTLTPPNLTAVGDKLRAEYLDLAVKGEAPTARPWLSVRMPSFAFEPGEGAAIAAMFRGHDRIVAEEPPAPPTRLDPETREVAARLIGQRGFGCLSCHVVAGRVPPGGEPETLGPDLALVQRRMTGRFFRRWIADPQRVIAGTPMPQFLKPVEGVPGTFDDQIDALWRLLGSGSLSEVTATGTREILKREGDRALVVRDMVLVPSLPDTPYTPRGLAVGFKNDVSLLFDTDRLGWLAAWDGGFLARTKTGRLWEWHPEGTPLWTAARRLPPVVLVAPDGSVQLPVEERERFGSFSELDFVGDGVRLAYSLRFANGTLVGVTEEVRPSGRGWERAVFVSGLPPERVPYLVEQPPGDAKAGEGVSDLAWTVGRERVTLETSAARGERPRFPGEPGALLVSCGRDGDRFKGLVKVRIESQP